MATNKLTTKRVAARSAATLFVVRRKRCKIATA
jgi:hypothetical protein